MQSSNYTDQELVKRIIQNDLSLGRRLADPDYQNEVYWRYLGTEMQEFKDVLYENPEFADVLKSLLKIEYIRRAAVDLVAEMEKAGLDHLPPERVTKLTEQQRTVYNVLVKYPHIDPDAHNIELTFRCWAEQNEQFKQLLENNPTLIRKLSKYSKPISCTRLRRFFLTDIKQQFG